MNNLKQLANIILRIGLAITFLWIGILIFRDPSGWGGYLQPWARGLLPLPLEQVMIGTAILDVIIGFLLLINVLTWLAALIGAIHLIIVLTVSGMNAITVRDIGLLAGCVSLTMISWPAKFNFSIRLGNKVDRPK